MKFFLGFCSLLLTLPAENFAGMFWQITDAHLDEAYYRYGDASKMCHNVSSGNKAEDIGYFGNYSCDAPWTLIESSIKAMAQFDPNPDFILWTGDNSPHVDNPIPPWNEIYDDLSRITTLLVETFPKVPIIPVLGNHDSAPPDDFPLTNNTFYTNYLQNGSWKKVIPEDAHPTFIKGGYYSRDVGDVTVLVLNTMLNSMTNPMRNESDPDPADQFQWLTTQLQTAKQKGRKVILTSHEPPGYFERLNIVPFLVDEYIDSYINLTLQYSDIILVHVFGHTHTDSFRLFASDRKHIKSAAFIAPSVTPLGIIHSPSGVNSAVNPAIRKYKHNGTTLTDYYQYYLNLSVADATGKADWELLYQATEAYNIPDLSVPSLTDLYVKFTNQSSEEFTRYYYYNTVGASSPPCDEVCWQNQICGIAHLTTRAMSACWSRFNGTGLKNASSAAAVNTGSPPRYDAIVIVIVLASIVLVVTGLLFYNHSKQNSEKRKYVRFTESHLESEFRAYW